MDKGKPCGPQQALARRPEQNAQTASAQGSAPRSELVSPQDHVLNTKWGMGCVRLWKVDYSRGSHTQLSTGLRKCEDNGVHSDCYPSERLLQAASTTNLLPSSLIPMSIQWEQNRDGYFTNSSWHSTPLPHLPESPLTICPPVSCSSFPFSPEPTLIIRLCSHHTPATVLVRTTPPPPTNIISTVKCSGHLTSLSIIFDILDCSFLKMLSSLCFLNTAFLPHCHFSLFPAGSSLPQALSSSLATHFLGHLQFCGFKSHQCIKSPQMYISRPDFSAKLKTYKSTCLLNICT